MVYLCLASETSGLHGGQDGLRLRVARFTSIGDLLATEANSLFVFGFWVFFVSFFFGCVGCFGPFVFVCLFVSTSWPPRFYDGNPSFCIG